MRGNGVVRRAAVDDGHAPNVMNDKTESKTEYEMPRYRSHKIVHALKIERIELDIDKAKAENRETDGSALIHPEFPFKPFKVDYAYVRKHNPEPGGYYVVYEDGYASWSPAKAFEDGYTRLI